MLTEVEIGEQPLEQNNPVLLPLLVSCVLLIFKCHVVLMQPNQVTFSSTTVDNISDTHGPPDF